MKKNSILKKVISLFSMGILVFSASVTLAQTNVYDDIIATSPNHTSLKAALDQEGLDLVLQDPSGTFTVFAPTNDAFDDLATALGTNIAGLLALPNLTDILTYHVLGFTAPSSSLTNGDIVTPEFTGNTVKLTVTAGGDVYANQALVETPDLTADNGVVHSTGAVLLSSETVVDVAIDNGFSTLATAVITAELLPALTDPFAELTVFAPTNAAFDDAVTALGIDIATLLTLPNLGDILTYHVLGAEVDAEAISNGDVESPLSSTNTLKLTKTSMGDVFVNQAQVTTADISADNGIVHVLDGVVLPKETVVDVALDNGFTSLAAAVITAELLPALSDPFAEFTVFAPTNEAFDDLAADLSTDITGLLALENLGDILLYHVVSGTVLSTELTAGPVATLNGATVNVDLSNGVMINQATVSLADVTADNGVVHVINMVLVPSPLGTEDVNNEVFSVYPNPAVNELFITNSSNTSFQITDIKGSTILNGVANNSIDVSSLTKGVYVLNLISEQGTSTHRIVKQ